MVDVKQPADGFKDAMASFGAFIGRSWPVWPTWSRITVGAPEEMARFKQAFVQMMAGKRGTFQAPQGASATDAHMDAFFRHA